MSGHASARDYQLDLIAQLRQLETRTRERSAQAASVGNCCHANAWRVC